MNDKWIEVESYQGEGTYKFHYVKDGEVEEPILIDEEAKNKFAELMNDDSVDFFDSYKEKKYVGYGYHGGGRKPLPEGERKVFKTVSISGTPEEIESLKTKAQESGMTVSRFVIENLVK